MTVRILLTGERDWTDQESVNRALENAVRYYNAQDITVVHGDCLTGADHFAELWCNKNGVKTERHPAKWKREDGSVDKGAGPKRNTDMVKLGANVCLAFYGATKINGSGTFDCLTKAVRAGIPVKITPRKNERI